MVLYVLGLGLARLHQLHTEEGTLNLRCRNLFLLGHSRGGIAGLGNLLRLGDLGGLSDGLGTNAQFARRRFLSDILGGLRVTNRNTVLQLPGLGDFLLTEGASLILYDLSGLKVRVSLNEGVERKLFGVLISQLSLRRSRTNLDDALSRLADNLRGVFGGDFTTLRLHVDDVLDLARLSFFDDLRLTRLEFTVNTNLDLKRGVFGPLDGLGRCLALGADLDDLLDRLLDALGSGAGLNNLRVLDGLGRGDLIFTRLAFLDNLLGTGLHGVVELDLGLERNSSLSLRHVRSFGLGTHTNDLLGRLLGALSRHFWVTRRLAVHDLLGRGYDLSTSRALLIDDLLALLEGAVEDDLSLKRDRLLNLGHHRGVLGCRTILDDLLDRVLGLLFLRGHSFLVALGCEVRGVGFLARNTLLDNLDLARLQLRVRAGLNRERNLGSPGDLRRRLRRLGADLDNLVNRLFGDFLGDLRVARLGVNNVSLDRHLLLARNTRGHNLRRTGRLVRIELDLHTERNLRRNRLGRRTSGLGTHANYLLGRLLGALSRHSRLTRRLAVDDLLGRGYDLSTSLARLVDLLFALVEGVVEDDLSLKRHWLLSLGHHSGVLGCRTILDNLVDWVLGLLLLRGHSCLIALGSEVSGVSLLARNTLLDNLDLTRLQLRVRAGNNLERNLGSPGDLLGRL